LTCWTPAFSSSFPGTETAIEVKSATKVSNRDMKGLRYLAEENVFQNFILVSQDPTSTRTGNYQALHWKKFLTDLWNDKFI